MLYKPFCILQYSLRKPGKALEEADFTNPMEEVSLHARSPSANKQGQLGGPQISC